MSKYEDSPVDEDAMNLLSELMTALDQKFGQELVNQHNDDKARYTSFKAKHNQCITTKDDYLEDEIALKEGKRDTARDKHLACRKLEGSTTSLQGTVAALQAGTVVISVAGHGGVESAYDTFDVDWKAYKNFEQPMAACSTDQSGYENDFCNWIEDKTAACLNFDHCIAVVDLAGEKSALETRLGNRETVQQTIDKLKCRLTRIINIFQNQGSAASDHSAADACNTVTATNDYTLDDAFLAIPIVETCSDGGDITSPTHGMPDANTQGTCDTWTGQYEEAGYAISQCLATCDVPSSPVKLHSFQFTIGWNLILQWSDGYTPTRQAVGALDAAQNQFAKLDDREINVISSGDTTYEYYMIRAFRDSTEEQIVVRVPAHEYNDMNWLGTTGQYCATGHNVVADTDVTACSDWRSAGTGGGYFNNGGQAGNNCGRWFVYIKTGGSECYTNRGLGRCINAGSSCSGNGRNDHPQRNDVRMYRWNGPH